MSPMKMRGGNFEESPKNFEANLFLIFTSANNHQNHETHNYKRSILRGINFNVNDASKENTNYFFWRFHPETSPRGGRIYRGNKKNLDGRGANNYELIGAGIGGNKVYDLYLRLEEDVLAKAPDAAVIWIGVNDVWHKTSLGTGTDFDKFQRFYVALIKKLREKNIKTILVTPAAIGELTDCSNTQDGDLNKYSKAIRKMAAENKCTLIDLRKIFLEYNAKNNPDNKPQGILTTDGVHLNDAGNQLTAEEMMKGLGILN